MCKDAATVQLLEVSEQLKQRYLNQAQACPLPFLAKALEINNQCDIDYRATNNKRLHLEIALLKMCGLCSSVLTLPTAQAQPVQMAQNKPAQQPVSQGTGQTHGAVPTPSAQPQQTTPPPPPQQPIVQQPTTQQSTAPVSTGSTPVQPTVRPRGTTSGISINSALQQAEKKNEEPEETWDNAFTQEQLTASWTDFVNRYKSISQSFAACIGKYTPKLIGSSEIHFSVDNKLFENDAKGMSALKHHLKNSLHNNQFKLIPEVMERPAEIEAYTDKDKFEKMVEERPFLRTLQTELKLEGDL